MKIYVITHYRHPHSLQGEYLTSIAYGYIKLLNILKVLYMLNILTFISYR